MRGRWRAATGDGAARGVMAVGREPGAPAGNHRAAWVMRGCKGGAHNGARAREQGGGGDAQQDGLGGGMQSRAPRHGAAARWGHRALPQRDTSGVRGRESGARGAHGGASGRRRGRAGVLLKGGKKSILVSFQLPLKRMGTNESAVVF